MGDSTVHATTSLIGDDSVLYQVRLHEDGPLLQNQLTSLPGDGTKVRTTQGFDVFTSDDTPSLSYAGYYRERKVSREEFYTVLADTRKEFDIRREDYCGYSGTNAPSGITCAQHFKAQEGETCGGFDTITGSPFSDCELGLECKPSGRDSIIGAENVCVKIEVADDHVHHVDGYGYVHGQSLDEMLEQIGVIKSEFYGIIAKATYDIATDAERMKKQSDDAYIDDDVQLQLNVDEGLQQISETIDGSVQLIEYSCIQKIEEFITSTAAVRESFEYELDQMELKVVDFFDGKVTDLENSWWEREHVSDHREKLNQARNDALSNLTVRKKAIRRTLERLDGELEAYQQDLLNEFKLYGIQNKQSYAAFAEGVVEQFSADGQENHDSFVEAMDQQVDDFKSYTEQLVKDWEDWVKSQQDYDLLHEQIHERMHQDLMHQQHHHDGHDAHPHHHHISS